MTQPNPIKPRRYLRTQAEYRWTGPKVAQFLRTLAATGSVTQAVLAVDMSRQSAYNLRIYMFRNHGPEFGQLWDQAMAMAVSRKVAARLAKMREAAQRELARREAARRKSTTRRKSTPGWKMTAPPAPCL